MSLLTLSCLCAVQEEDLKRRLALIEENRKAQEARRKAQAAALEAAAGAGHSHASAQAESSAAAAPGKAEAATEHDSRAAAASLLKKKQEDMAQLRRMIELQEAALKLEAAGERAQEKVPS